MNHKNENETWQTLVHTLDGSGQTVVGTVSIYLSVDTGLWADAGCTWIRYSIGEYNRYWIIFKMCIIKYTCIQWINVQIKPIKLDEHHF